jgi:ATP-dependent Clp protease protease subunit
VKQELFAIISKHSGKPIEEVARDSDRDFWMTASEAKNYGMVDDVLVKK